MKKINILLLSGLMLASWATAQTEVTTGIMRGKDYGVTYMLPKTEIEFILTVTRHTYTPGELCRYADRYLRLTDVSAQPSENWTLDNIETRVIGVPDKEKVYFVKLKDKSTAPLMELTEEGVVRSINMPFSGGKTMEQQPKEATASPQEIDPRSFLTEEILLASSSSKIAELVAKEIYTIRESRNALLRGEAETMPTDGAQLKLMLDNLSLQEQAMMEMFAGKKRSKSETITIRLTPKAMKEEVAFRFSKKLGVVANDDLAGEPYYLTISSLETPGMPAENPERPIEGIAFNLPGQAQITLAHNGKKVFDQQLPLTQFGTIEYLASVLFNKNSTTKVLFDTNTGGVIKVERDSGK